MTTQTTIIYDPIVTEAEIDKAMRRIEATKQLYDLLLKYAREAKANDKEVKQWCEYMKYNEEEGREVRAVNMRMLKRRIKEQMALCNWVSD